MTYDFDRSLGRLIEAGTPPLAFLADRGKMSLTDVFMLLCKEFEEAYDNGTIQVEGTELCFKSSLANIILKPNEDESSPYPYYLRFKLEVVQEPLTAERIDEIHAFLLEHFAPEEWHSMVTVSQVMNKNGYSKERFGFSKMTNLYLALSRFITIRDTVENGTPAKDVKIASVDQVVQTEQQSTVPYAFSSVLSELIDPAGASIAAFARDCGKDVGSAFETLSDAFLEAYSQGILREEDTALHFKLGKYAITLVTNSLESSPYPYYMRFATEDLSAPVTEVLTLEDEQEIYRLLTRKFVSGIEFPMAQISAALNAAGLNKERFGFTKMKDMLETLQRFVTLRETTIKGAHSVFVKIHRVSDWDRQLTGQTSTEKEGVLLPERLNQRNVNMSNKTLSIINQALCGINAIPEQRVIDAICAAYDAAPKPEGKRFHVDETFRFSTGLQTRNGEEIEATIKASDMANVDWYLNWGGASNSKMSVKPGGELEQHAYLGPWSEFLEKLANMALPEKWSFKDAAEGDYTILRQYIKFTFHHLQNDDKVLENADHTFCAFNTGLVDRHYDDIYACFTRNPLPGKQDWLFTDFCIAGRRGLGKELINAFEEPPSVASYFTEKDELLFNVDCNRFYDYQHMIVENIDRLPLDFLAEELGGNKEASALVHELTETPPQSRGPIYEKLKDLLDEEERLYNRLKNRFNDAIDLAIKRVRWNYKTAIPCYYPTTGKMCFMLPLALVDDNRTDVALVMEKKDSGSYQGQTILTLQAAYIDARLICRPDSDWLRTNEIRVTDDDGDELVSED